MYVCMQVSVCVCARECKYVCVLLFGTDALMGLGMAAFHCIMCCVCA